MKFKYGTLILVIIAFILSPTIGREPIVQKVASLDCSKANEVTGECEDKPKKPETQKENNSYPT